MTLRVLLTHERFPPDFKGGGEYIVLNTALGLQARGIDVRVLTAGDPAVREYCGVPTTRLAVGSYRFNLQAGAIASALSEADIVHTFNYHACLPSLVAARRTHRPVVCEMLGLFGNAWRNMRGPLVGRLYTAWERLLVTRAYDRTIFLSEASRADGVALGVPVDRSAVISPGIHHDRIRASTPKQPFVLYAGQLSARKGVKHLLAMARALPHIPFRAIGWSDNFAELAAAAPPNLEITAEDGHATSVDRRYFELLGEAAIFFLPSYAETFGITVVEAMASGCAIVSTIDAVSFAGEKVAPGDEEAMLGALLRLWEDPAHVARLGAENRRRAADFTWKVHVDRLLAVYGRALRRELGEYAAGATATPIHNAAN